MPQQNVYGCWPWGDSLFVALIGLAEEGAVRPLGAEGLERHAGVEASPPVHAEEAVVQGPNVR